MSGKHMLLWFVGAAVVGYAMSGTLSGYPPYSTILGLLPSSN